MTEAPDPALQAARREVQRLLGACLLGLQACEGTAKAILATQEICVSPGSDPVDRGAQVARMTLGQLVDQLFATYLRDAEPADDDDPAGTEAGSSFRARAYLILPPETLARIATELRDFVQLRNRLVHHFFEDHDLHTEAGCLRAQDQLSLVRDRISNCRKSLQDWARGIDSARKALAGFLVSEAGRDFIDDGLAPDGTVCWPIAGITGALRSAHEAVQIGGWARLDAAIRWIEREAPDQQPARYGCRSWPHVIHASGAFDLRRHTETGDGIARFRPRQPGL